MEPSLREGNSSLPQQTADSQVIIAALLNMLSIYLEGMGENQDII